LGNQFTFTIHLTNELTNYFIYYF